MRASVVFPQPGLARQREHLAAPKGQVDTVDGARDGGLLARHAGSETDAALEGDVEAADLQDGIVVRRRGGRVRDGLAHVGTPAWSRTSRQAALRCSPASYRSGTTVGAFVERDGAAWVERAPRGDRVRLRRIPAESGRRPAEALVADRREGGGERRRVRMRRLAEHRSGRALLDDLARVHDREAIAHLHEHGQIVGDEQHRQPHLVLELVQQLEDLGLDHHVERRGGFVRDDQARAARERHRDHHPLLLPARQLVRVVADAPRRQADLLEQVSRPDHALPSGSIGGGSRPPPPVGPRSAGRG